MIKVSFCCVDTTLDVCKLLEENLTNHVEIEVWLEEQIRTVSFDCMDFPHDLDAYYDCYFQSEQEELDAQAIEILLSGKLSDFDDIQFEVHLVDERLKEISVVKSCPYCGQGWLQKAMVKATKEIIFICDECDTVWDLGDQITNQTGIAFGTYAKDKKIKALWSELDFLD